jgi:hypothetical protein
MSKYQTLSEEQKAKLAEVLQKRKVCGWVGVLARVGCRRRGV